MNKYKLSVVVTSYNYEQFIETTIKSLLDQTVIDYEILIIDDGSTDQSVSIIEKYAKENKNIRFIQHPDKKNHGLVASIFYAVKQSSGEYIAFCESDDYWELNHVELLLNCIQRSQPIIILNKVVCINNSKNKGYDRYIDKSNKFLKNKDGKNIFFHLLYKNLIPTFSAACIRKDILIRCNFDSPIKQHLDYWLWRQICFFYKIYFLEDCKTYWRKHDKSYIMTSPSGDGKKLIYLSNKIILKEYTLTKYQKLIMKIYTLICRFIINFRPFLSNIRSYLRKVIVLHLK